MERDLTAGKTGLVLEGGAMRGMYTAGVLDTLMRNHITVDGIVGVSAGALFGVNFLSGQIGRVIRYNKRFNRDKNYLGLRPLLREGNIVNTQYAYDEVPRKLDVFDDEAFQASHVPFYAVVTRMDTGKAEYIRISSAFAQMDTLRASGSMPFVSRPVEIDGTLYLDGGVADSIPYEWMASQGYEKLVVVLTRDRSYRKKPKAFSGLSYRKYPRFRKVLSQRHTQYNAEVEKLTEWEAQGKAFVFRPSQEITIGRTEKDPDKLQEVYDLGVRDAEKGLPQLLTYLQFAPLRAASAEFEHEKGT